MFGGTPLPLFIGIIELQAKTRKIFEFKRHIWKIFRNKDLRLSRWTRHRSFLPAFGYIAIGTTRYTNIPVTALTVFASLNFSVKCIIIS
jgi:hypothetical protein